MKLNNIEFDHRNLNIQLRFQDGFAPVWNVYVRWPGYKNRKYFTMVPAWRLLPSKVKDLVKMKIDAELGLAWIDITTMSTGTHRYKIKTVTDHGDFIFTCKDLLNNQPLRFNPKEGRVEVAIPEKNGEWDVYISDAVITQVDMWDWDRC